MALFKNMIITNKGMALYTKAQAGKPIIFSKIKVGSGQIGTQNPATLTTLVHEEMDVSITSITPKTDLKTAVIIGNVTNENVTEAVYICEIGLYATDPDEGEILYGYASCGEYGDYYAPYSQGPYSWQYEINAAVGNAANVTAEISVLTWDYAITNSNSFSRITGGNQKELNLSIDSHINTLYNNIENIVVPVSSVNSKTGNVVLSASDVKDSSGNTVQSDLDNLESTKASKTLVVEQISASRNIVDSITSGKYQLKIENGIPFLEEVE